MKDIDKLPYWPRGLSRTLAASYVGVSPGTFDKLVKGGYMPRPKAIYGRRVWDVRAVDVAFDLLDGGYTTKMGEGEVYEFSDMKWRARLGVRRASCNIESQPI